MQLPKRKPGKYSQGTHDPMITQEKLDQLQKELARLYSQKPSAAEEVSRLAELGDFSENAEYQAAKRRLRGINSAITLREHQINSAQIIQKTDSDKVSLGSKVTVETQGETATYTILGSSQTDPSKGVISHNSPLGTALIGRKKDDTVEVTLPRGTVSFKIKKIS